ncbi:MAG: hypothetical protein JRG95_11385 [Deltaproteobacteria bacterium]|nr:hypothetical protein [Deltaproteobacteria bacterium]
MSLFEVFDWLEQLPIGVAIRDSLWLFPVVEAGHLLGFVMLGGAVFVLDLRLLGFGLRERSIAYVERQTRPWLIAAVGVLFATGIPLFLSEAIKCYYSTAFWVKMGALGMALPFTFVFRNRLAQQESLRPANARWLGTASIAVWLTVAAAGRWIGFS